MTANEENRLSVGPQKMNRMKKNKNYRANGNGTATRCVRLEFIHPTAKSVSVAGTFNEWRPGATEMIALENGRWLKELVLQPGTYEYQLVVDNQWMPDPLATETTPNSFGGVNSVLRVAGTCEGSGAEPGSNARDGEYET